MVLLAFCRQCGEPLGAFFELSELKIFLMKNPKCPGSDCPVTFKLLGNGQLWDVSYEEHPDSSYEHYLIHKAINDAIGFQAQSIFCYEDIGRGNGFARYPQRRIVFEFEPWVERATKAFIMYAYEKEGSRTRMGQQVAKFYFDNPDALVQLAASVIRGYYEFKKTG